MSVVPIAVLASGNGSNLQALLDASLEPGEVRVVVVNVPGARALARAEAAGVEAILLDHTRHPSREAYDDALGETLVDRGVQMVVLAGFMRLVTAAFLDRFPQRVINIHPSLLPAFPGLHAQRQALRAGVRVTGCTVHLVDAGVDTGPILAQAAVPVRGDDDEASLSRRILAQEHRILPAVVRAVAAGGLRARPGGGWSLDIEDRDEAALLTPGGLT